jgi:methylmalonyl-CoA mutase C-terminal domain/subunit
MTLFKRVREMMDDRGLKEVRLMGGGIIPDEDVEKLKALGVDQVFGPGTDTREIVDYVRELFKEKTKKKTG